MKREQLEHAIRAAGAVLGVNEVLVSILYGVCSPIWNIRRS